MANHDRGSREVNLSPFKTIHQNLSRPQPKMHNLRLLSRPLTKTQVTVYFQDHLPKVAKMNHLTSFKTTGSQSEQMAGSFKTMEDGSQKLTHFKTLAKRVQRLNPRYMVPVNEASWINFRSSDSKDGTTSERSALEWSTTKRIKIQPHLHGAWIYIHRQYQGSSNIVPQQLWLHRWHVRRIRHQNRPYSPSSTKQKMESSYQVQGGDWERAGRDGVSRNHHQTDWSPHHGSALSHTPRRQMASWGFASTQRTWTKPSSVRITRHQPLRR